MKIAGIRFRENWKVYDFDATDFDVSVGDIVIVDSDRGPGFARVVRLKQSQEPPAAPTEQNPQESGPGRQEGNGSGDTAPAAGPAAKGLRKIIRKATDEDIRKDEKNSQREAEGFTLCQEMIGERELLMKLIRVEYSFDASRAAFFFFSETRVDFRELVKDLAYKLKARIEMRQVGVRDVARLIGGYGSCGRELCCSSFLRNFEPVSIRMAKKQEMVLNPAKISGVCGRLLCCLSYEYEMYDEIKKDVANMREAANKGKKEEEELRIAEDRREAEERRIAEAKRRQEEERQRQEARQKQKGGEPRGGRRPDRKEGGAPDRRPQAQPDQPPRPPQQQQQQQPDAKQAPQKAEQQGEKAGQGKGRRRFWRNKKKKQRENKPQGPAQS
ncbi:MAG: regulatory iron-sulfur-containing complex subunit RicT [Nitrospirota bacterium]